MGVVLSLIIPAYNEATRLPPYLRSIREYFSRVGFGYEVIVVDDGSGDNLADVIRNTAASWPELRLMQLDSNQGRGQAIRSAAAVACGNLHLYADADGATPIDQERTLRQAIDSGADVAVGSRMIAQPGIQRRRMFHRALMGKTFSGLTRLLLGSCVRDSQCGFKMWRREVGVNLLGICKENGYLLDTELVLFAQRLGYQVSEVPVSWHEVPGSKVRLVRDSWRMFCGLCRLRRSVADRANVYACQVRALGDG
jgi:dolichyl-phosphate beta-glucosyltransferase